MDFSKIKAPVSHGTGQFDSNLFRYFGNNIVVESGVLFFHPENISVADKVYIGHQSILNGYFKGQLTIGEGSWIGQHCFLHAAGTICIGKSVGIGPFVKILSSQHQDINTEIPVMSNPLDFAPVVICDGADIGIGTIILPGVTIGEGAIIGAGAVVNRNVIPYSVYAGVPAKLVRNRKRP